MQLKYDISINLKHEKEIFRFIRLVIFTLVFSWFFLGVPEYIWNMKWYWIMVFVSPWCAAIPSIVNLIVRKVSVREIVGEHIGWQILTGCGLALACALPITCITIATNYNTLPQLWNMSGWKMLRLFFYYLCVIGPSEELIYRVAIMGSLREICDRHRWLAPLMANTLFALAHLLYNDWRVALFAFVFGLLYTIPAYCWKRCRFVMLLTFHGMYDFLSTALPYAYVWMIS